MVEKNCVGAIVCKLDMHKKMFRRGYIAMLAVDSKFRRKGIGMCVSCMFMFSLANKTIFLWVFQVLGVTWMTLPAKFTYWRTQLWGSTGLHAVLLWSVGKIMENEAKYENIKGGWLSVRKSGGSLWNQSKSIRVEWILILSNLSVVISGTNLVKKAIYAMVEGDCDEVRDSLALNW